ncbi:MAG: DUF2252 family protein [Puia sp.]|nr:DUF2252 family protein [Puia sp.]
MATIVERIKQFNSDRIPVYTALKYKMMAQNAFRFFRGTCHLFYEDLKESDAIPQYPLSWICGDLHLENFGSYKGDNRLVYFDLNDFDEAVLAPVTWELARMITSIFTGLDSLGIKKKEATRVARLFLHTYSEMIGKGKARYIEPQTARGIVLEFLDQVCERRQKELLRARTVKKEGRLKLLIDEIRLFALDKPLKRELTAHLTKWIGDTPLLRGRYRVIDAAFRIAGTGSIGVRRYVFLLKTTREPKKHLLIDMKQSPPSSVQPYCVGPQPAWSSEAERVVTIQEHMQNIAPALLSTTMFKEQSYVVKEMQPADDKINFLLIKDHYEDISRVIRDMALLTASAQLRSSGRRGSAVADELVAFGNDHHWQAGILEYASGYAAKVKKDYREFLKAYNAGSFDGPKSGKKPAAKSRKQGDK